MVLAVTAAVLAVRVVVAVGVPIVDDEAYYWVWAQHLSWGYPDHPPLIAALVALGIRLFGDGVFAIRIVPIVLATAGLPLVYLAGRDMFDEATGRRAVLLAAVLPIFILGPALAFPDSALMLFWTLGLWSGWRALQRGGWWWVVAAAAAALALLSKVTAGFLPLGIAAVWLSDPWRRALRDRRFYAGLAAGLLLILPTTWWYAHNRWALVRMFWDRPPWLINLSVPLNVLYSIGGQILYHGALWPFLVAAMVAAAARRSDLAWRYLAWTSVPLLAVTIPLAIIGQAKPHWPSPAYTSAAIALAALWPLWRRVRRAVLAAAALSGVVIVVAAAAALSPAGREFEGTGTGWRRAAQDIYRQAEERHAFILTSNYQSASQMLYHAPPPVPVTSPIGAYRLWQPAEPLAGRTAIFVMDTGADPTEILAQMCGAVHRIGRVRGVAGRTLRLYNCAVFSGSFALYPAQGLP
jgi:4-amino-4-deoxy-L-arabinose transferase-like glycosyltransferase